MTKQFVKLVAEKVAPPLVDRAKARDGNWAEEFHNHLHVAKLHGGFGGEEDTGDHGRVSSPVCPWFGELGIRRQQQCGDRGPIADPPERDGLSIDRLKAQRRTGKRGEQTRIGRGRLTRPPHREKAFAGEEAVLVG